MPVVPLEAFLDKANNQNSPFDYLIVGGGSTGLVIANRSALAQMMAAIAALEVLRLMFP